MTRRPALAAHSVTVWAFVLAAILPASAQRGPDGTARSYENTREDQTEISGTVVTTGVSPMPLARVLVTISGPSLRPSRTMITDDQGRFAFRSLPGGAFTIVAMRPPYVKTAFGAKRPGRPGTPINLAAGQRVAGVTIPLARGAAITGMIRQTDGKAAPGVNVQVTPLDSQAGPLGTAVATDDRGIYRVFGLPPGKYLVMASVTSGGNAALTQFSDAEMDESLAKLERRSANLTATGGAATTTRTPGSSPARPDSNRRLATYGYAPIYYPETPDPDQATTLVLAEGEERAGIDIGLQLVRTVAIDGRVSIPNGVLPPGTQVTLAHQGLRDGSGPANTRTSPATRSADISGNFRFTGILPGNYRIVARATTTATPVRTPAPAATSSTVSNAPVASITTGVFWALADVTIADDDVSDLALMLRPGLRLSGRLVFETHAQMPPRDLTTIRLRLADVSGASAFVPPSGRGRADGTFEISGILPGTYGMTSTVSDAVWWLRSVVVGGRDVLDVPFELGPTGDVSGVVATFTDQHTELSGTLQTAANIAAPDYFVVVFSSDRTFWRPGSRRVQFTRPSTDGHFTLRDFPAGDYLIAALTDMEASDLADGAFMERLVPAALPVHLNDGEKKTQDVRLAR